MKRPETVQTEKHEKPKMKKTAVLSRLLPYLMRYKFLMLGAILLTVGGNLLSLAGPYISGLAVDAMELGRGKVNFEKVGCYGVLMVVMYAISAALSYALTRLMIVISRRVVNTMRHDVFQKLSELPVGYFDTHQTGDILSRISYDIDTINTSLTNDMVQVFASAVTVIGALIMMLSISPTLVLVFVFTVPLSMFMTKKITGFTRPLFRKRSAKLGELNGFVEEMISGQKTLRAYSQEENTIKKLDDLLRVEANGGLVQNEDRRVAEQSLRNADTLLVALRQVADETIVDVVDLRQAADLADVLLAVELDALQLIHEVEVLFDRHIHVKRRKLRQVADELFHFVRVFQGIFALYRDRTARGGKVPGDDIHGCGFTCTVRPEEADDGALFNREADIVQRGICTVALREVFDLDHV